MDTPPPPNGSALCLACGLCCAGVLHPHAALAPDEIPLAQQLSLKIITCEDGLAFQLPCPRLSGTRCLSYECRPKTCAAYRCKLFKQYLRAEVTLEQAKTKVQAVTAQLSTIELDIGRRAAADQSIWQQLTAWRVETQIDTSPEARRQHAPSLLQMARLLVLMRRNFGITFPSEK